ncbi:coiled-coil domain-containing protein 160 [Bombina bombina]|uniref:coiled-coil domain-containing protein 160 n=1 Tax=Bombina bombina TaxID=8345 RepID=UPI00235AA745|nr:coiled-coil domain-containing protein 160 [Bombina bombina]
MEAEDKHWVKTLFSPHFTAQDFFDLPFEPEELASEKTAKEKAMAVEQIYNAAIVKSQKAERLKRREMLSKMIVRDCDLTLYEKNIKQVKPNAGQTETCTCAKMSNVRPSSVVESSDQCIWIGKELNVLRHQMNKQHMNEASLKLHLNACEREISELKVKYSVAERELEAVKTALAISKKQTACKQIHLSQVEKDLRKKDAVFQDLRRELQGKCMKLSAVNKHLIKVQEENQDLQLKNKDLEAEIKKLKQQQEIKNAEFAEKIKLNCNIEKNKLLREIETVREELINEKKQHARDVTALESLRKHFSSLSMNSSPNIVQLNIAPH